jgi:hypothetical protein
MEEEFLPVIVLDKPEALVNSQRTNLTCHLWPPDPASRPTALLAIRQALAVESLSRSIIVDMETQRIFSCAFIAGCRLMNPCPPRVFLTLGSPVELGGGSQFGQDLKHQIEPWDLGFGIWDLGFEG